MVKITSARRTCNEPRNDLRGHCRAVCCDSGACNAECATAGANKTVAHHRCHAAHGEWCRDRERQDVDERRSHRFHRRPRWQRRYQGCRDTESRRQTYLSRLHRRQHRARSDRDFGRACQPRFCRGRQREPERARPRCRQRRQRIDYRRPRQRRAGRTLGAAGRRGRIDYRHLCAGAARRLDLGGDEPRPGSRNARHVAVDAVQRRAVSAAAGRAARGTEETNCAAIKNTGGGIRQRRRVSQSTREQRCRETRHALGSDAAGARRQAPRIYRGRRSCADSLRAGIRRALQHQARNRRRCGCAVARSTIARAPRTGDYRRRA